jgi:penicillin-binding protein 2
LFNLIQGDPTSQQQPGEPKHDSNVLLREDTKFATAKVAIFQYIAVAIFILLVVRFWDLQVRNEGIYKEQAERNRIKSIPLLAPRGKILDRDGRVIVDNHSTFSLILTRENLKEEHLKPIADGLGLSYDELVSKVRRFRNRPKYEPIIIKAELSPADLAFVNSHKDPETFPEMELIQAQRRLYPQDGLAAHVIGYVGEVSENELNSPEFIKYEQGDVVGKQGIERQYNDMLMGVDGQRQVIVDNRGNERAILGVKDAIPGKDLQLTIDLDLQAVAELAMDGRKGAVVALDPRNGEVLAMVSRPAYDPNRFAGRIKASDWKEILSNPDHPMLNRVIQAQLAPGSTFKPIMALAALESGTVDPSWTVGCGGGASFYGRYFKCWQKGGHGRVDLHKAITHSCDVYFYTVGNKMGIDTIAKYAEMAGLGEKTGIDLPNEASGVMPSTTWKMRNFRQKWYAGETISVSIGQGAVTVTPLQLARAIGGIATGGVWQRPHLVKEDSKGDEGAKKADLNLDNVMQVINGMYSVVNEGGTGIRCRLPGVEVCGKTGSAQVVSNQFVRSAAKGGHPKDNAWFVGFAPRQSPEIVVVSMWEGGEHGMLAAPIARDIIKAYFDKKARQQRPTELLAKGPNFGPIPPATPEPADQKKPEPEEVE